MDEVGSVNLSRGLWVVACTFGLGACAGTPPFFQRHFSPGFQQSHNLWASLLTQRYACDTNLVRSMARASRRVQLGMAACDLAAVVEPETVRAWRISQGIREEWTFRTRAGDLGTVYLEGRDEQTLRVANPVSRLLDAAR